TRYEGRVVGFTGDGIFAVFGLSAGGNEAFAQKANECAFQIHGFTKTYFAQERIARKLVAHGGLHIKGSRTVLHWAEVMYGQIASAPSVIGPQVVALFRACDRDELFDQHSVILTEPFIQQLRLPSPPSAIIREVVLDSNLPPMSFYAHPSFASVGVA